MSLFVAGIWVGMVSTRGRDQAETLVRQLVGDGLVETIVTVDDLPESQAGPGCDAELYRLALWEFGIAPQQRIGRREFAVGIACRERRGAAVGCRNDELPTSTSSVLLRCAPGTRIPTRCWPPAASSCTGSGSFSSNCAAVLPSSAHECMAASLTFGVECAASFTFGVRAPT